VLGVRQSPEKGKGIRKGLGGPIRYVDFRVDRAALLVVLQALGLKGEQGLFVRRCMLPSDGNSSDRGFELSCSPWIGGWFRFCFCRLSFRRCRLEFSLSGASDRGDDRGSFGS
jgi:hypothetical protein